MSNVLTHRFVSPKVDGTDLTQVQPSAWNDGHRFSGGLTGDVLTRDTGDATFGASWVTPAGWVAFTPSWWTNNVLRPLGNHAIAGAYHRRGDAVWYQIRFSVGTDALPAPGSHWAFGLPFPCVPTLTPGTGTEAAGAGLFPLVGSAFGTPDRITLYYVPAAQVNLALMTDAAPTALASGSLIEMRGNYQAA